MAEFICSVNSPTYYIFHIPNNAPHTDKINNTGIINEPRTNPPTYYLKINFTTHFVISLILRYKITNSLKHLKKNRD